MEQEKAAWGGDSSADWRLYRNIHSPYMWGFEKWLLVHGPLHTLGRSTDPIWAKLLLPLAQKTKQLALFTGTHMSQCVGYAWANRYQLNDGVFESTAPVGVAQAATMKENLLPENECETCAFKMPSAEWKNVWWAARSLLRLWRMSRRILLTRNIEWQRQQTQFLAPLSYLYDSFVALLIGPSGDTPTARHFSSRYPLFLTKCNDNDVLVRDQTDERMKCG